MNKQGEITITEQELSLVENNSLNANQLAQILKKTPAQYTKTRPAKGGGQWTYVTGGYIKKCLNLMFGWDWDFEIVDEKVMIEAKEVVVKGRLTCRTNDRTIVKMQYGNKDIMFRTTKDKDGNKISTNTPLSVGNDMKAAATDCLKKCAAEIGIAADIYNPEEFREVKVEDSKQMDWDNLDQLYELKKEEISPEEQANIERIIKTKEAKSFSKLNNYLNQL